MRYNLLERDESKCPLWLVSAFPGGVGSEGLASNRRKEIVLRIKNVPRNRAKTSLFPCERPLFSCKSSLFREMKLPVSGPGAAVARPPRPISAADRRHGGAPSAPRPLRPQAAVKILGESHILCYICSLGSSHGESVMSNRLHPSRPIALGNGPRRMLASPRFASRGPLRGLLKREAWAPTRASSSLTL